MIAMSVGTFSDLNHTKREPSKATTTEKSVTRQALAHKLVIAIIVMVCLVCIQVGK